MSTTRLRIWHPYRADVVGKGQRKPRRVTLRAPLDLEVRTASAADVQVVGRALMGRPDWAKTGRGEERSYTFKGFDGSLWMPATRGAEYGFTDEVGWNRIMLGTNRWPPFLFDPILMEHEQRTGSRLVSWRDTTTPDAIEGEIVANDRVVSAEAAKRLEAELLMVDGKIWQSQPEPVWAIEQLGLSCYCVYLDIPPPGRHPFRSNAETAFRADRLEDMLAWSAEIGRARHRDPETFGPSGRVIEFDPAFLRRDDLVIETCRLGEQVLKVFAERVAHMTLSGIDAYALARAAHQRLATDGSRSDIPSFLDGVESVAADLRRFDYPDGACSSRDDALKTVDVLHRRIRNYEGADLAAAYGGAPPEIAARAPTT